MGEMILLDIIKNFLLQTYNVFLESSIYILIGFFLAGLIDIFLKQEWILKFMTGKGLKPIVYASLFGVPIPLCSCGVLPTSLALDKKGAKKEATMSFLISTPETGVGSIVLTYGLLGPVFAIFRPIASFLTAMIAGIFYGGNDKGSDSIVEASGSDNHVDSGDPIKEKSEKKSGLEYLKDKCIKVYKSGFEKLFDEVSLWIFIGLLITGFLSILIPENFFEKYLGSGLISMIVMILIGIPLYMCAASSTPIAAALIAKGLNPGAAFVFLLAGPATNAATITVLLKQFGKRFVRIYVTSIIAVSIVLGLFFNYILGVFGIKIKSTFENQSIDSGNFFKFIGVLLFLLFLGMSFKRIGLGNLISTLKSQMTDIYTGFKNYNWSEIHRNPFFLGVFIILFCLYISTAFFIVKPGEVGITKVFGRVTNSDLKPGFHMKYPYPVGSSVICNTEFIRKINLGFMVNLDTNYLEKDLLNYDFNYQYDIVNRDRQIRVEEESFNLTGDENLIDISYSIHYRVSDPLQFTFGVESADDLIRCASRNSLLESLANKNIDEIYTTFRREIEESTYEKLQSMIDDYDIGVEIVRLQLLRVHAPEEVHFAFRDVASASEDKNMMINKAYGDYEETVNLAYGSSEKSILEAKSYSFKKISEARGNATGFELQFDAYLESKSLTRFRLYNEVLQRFLVNAKLYIKPDAESGGDMEIYVLKDDGRGFSFIPSESGFNEN